MSGSALAPPASAAEPPAVPSTGLYTPPSAEEELERLTQLLYQMPVGMARCRADGTVEMINPLVASMFAHRMATWFSGNLFDLLRDCFPDLRDLLAAHPGSGRVFEGKRVPVSSPLPGAEPVWLLCTALKLESGDFALVLQDISVEVSREQQMRQAGAWIAALVHGDNAYFSCRLDASGRVAYWSADAERLTGLQPNEVLGRGAEALFATGFGEACDEALDPSRFAGRMSRAMRSGWDFDEGWMRRRDAQPFFASSLVTCAEDASGDGPGFVLVARDMSNRREAVQALRRLTVYDYLTGCYNRAYLFTAGEEELAMARVANRPVSLVVFDVDRFKAINDTHGHDAGDAVLQHLALACQRQLRGGELLARLGGEEFCVLLAGCDLADAAAVAERMRVAISAEPVRRSGATIHATASFGVVQASERGATLAQLVQRADAAMYAAKRAGRDRVEIAGA